MHPHFSFQAGRNHHGFRPALLSVLAMLLVACGQPERRPPLPEPRAVGLVGDDGTRVAATFYPADEPDAPGLLLIHGLRGHRDDWRRFARAAQRAGFASLSMDLRGHGDTTEDTRGRILSPGTLTRDDWRLVTSDIDAARRTLLERGVHPEELAVVGASVGANLGLQFAVLNDDIQAVVLLSPGLVIEGIEAEAAMAAYTERPALIMFGAHDAYAAASGRTLAALAPSFFEVREYATSAHGAMLFDVSDQALEQAVYWLGTILRGAHLPESRPLVDTLP